MSADLIKALRFHGRYAAETEEQMRLRKYGEREQAATELEQLRATVDRLAGELQAIPAAAGGQQLAHGHRGDFYQLANARRIGMLSIERVKKMPNWVLAMELFATGSTSAHQICRDAGIAPDGYTLERHPPPAS